MYKPSHQQVGIAELKAHLSDYLRQVRAGKTVTVCDRDRPIARLVPIEQPIEGLVIRPAREPGGFRNLNLSPKPPLDPPVDIVALLLEDRRKR